MKLCVKIDQQSYEVEVGDLQTRPILATVDGDLFEVWPEEEIALHTLLPAVTRPAQSPVPPVQQPAPNQDGAKKAKTIYAPIPGVILSVQVKPGDVVAFGQELCVLEAMKMKNQVRANRAGTIRAVYVSPGDQVRHNQVLVEFTE